MKITQTQPPHRFSFFMRWDVLFIILLCIISLQCGATSPITAHPSDSQAASAYDSLSNFSNKKLLVDSRKWIEADTLSELSVTALTIVTNRYYDNPTDPQMQAEVTEGLRMLGNLYMVRVINYKKAYKSLWMARQIAEENGDNHSLSSIYSSLANLYSVNPGDPARKSQKVEEYLSLAADAAIKSDNKDLLRTITISMSVWSFPRKKWGKLIDSINRIRKGYSSDVSFAGPLAAASACDSYFAGDTDSAEQKLLEARSKLDFTKFSERYRYSMDLILSDLYAETKQYDKALTLMKADMEMAENAGHTDFLLNVYEQMTRLFREAGVPDSTDYYYLKYSKLKNDFAEKSSFGKVEELDFLSQIDSINAEVERLSLKRRQEERRNIIILAALIVALIVICAMLWIYLNLKRNHRNLFERNREMLQRENEHRLLRELWEEERLRLIGQDKKEEANDEQEPQQSEEEDLSSLKQLYSHILMIFEESPEIYGLGFSLADLAKMIGKPIRVVSKAINVCHGGNFHQLLNKYRLREAARLMHDPENITLTIEGIAERAGFKSRTSFAALFKKAMGLTPSEYWRLAQKDQAGSLD